MGSYLLTFTFFLFSTVLICRLSCLANPFVDFYVRNQQLANSLDRECFSTLAEDESIDFVIDIAPSPELDPVDRAELASLPISHHQTNPSRAYFDTISVFIDAVTLDMKPEQTRVVILNNGERFSIKGRSINATVLKPYGQLVDLKHNLRTLWAVPTNSQPEYSAYGQLLTNNLGRLTMLALWNRDNGLPTVLGGFGEKLKPFYTVVITDGSSGSKIGELVGDRLLALTTVIDIGKRRFVSKLSWDVTQSLASVSTLPEPQGLPTLVDTIRNMACLISSNKNSSP